MEWQANTPQVITVRGMALTTFMAALGTPDTLPDGYCYVLTVWYGDWRTAQDQPSRLGETWLESGSCYGVSLEGLVDEAIMCCIHNAPFNSDRCPCHPHDLGM